MYEFDNICDGIEVERKMAVSGKLGKNKEMKPGGQEKGTNQTNEK